MSVYNASNVQNHPAKSVEELKSSIETLQQQVDQLQLPNGKKHLYVSLVKSAIRLLAGCCLIVGLPVWCGIGIVAAEVLGVVEELV
jgi:hypothetical protein